LLCLRGASARLCRLKAVKQIFETVNEPEVTAPLGFANKTAERVAIFNVLRDIADEDNFHSVLDELSRDFPCYAGAQTKEIVVKARDRNCQPAGSLRVGFAHGVSGVSRGAELLPSADSSKTRLPSKL
jgi:hypothetical protein